MNKPGRRSTVRIRLPLWGAGLLILFIILAVFGGAIWLFHTVQEIAATWEITSPDFQADNNGTTSHQSEALPPPQTTLLATPLPTLSEDALKPWAGQERVNILLLGIDLRCGEEGPTHTDTMMVLTADPVGLSAAVLSLPRDLWVEIPGFEVDRINQAHYYGEIYEYPGGGPALAVETVENTLGIDINYYAAVNFQAFVDLVDLIEGITVNNQEVIEDPDYPDSCYGYDPFFLTVGEHELNGETALKYARTRVTLGGDVDRAARQQEVLLAVREKVLQLNILPQLLTQSPRLWQSFQTNVHTNMSLEEAIQLALLLQEIPSESIQTAVIDYNYVYTETTPDGRQVLVPIRDNIRALRDRLFLPPAIPTPVIENLPALALQEAAHIKILNGTPIFGLASATQSYLQSFALNITEIGNADAATYSATQIIDFGSHPYTTHYLTQLMSLPPLNVSIGNQPDGDYEILIILGNDWQLPEE